MLHRLDVVAVDRADVLQPEVLEHALWGDDVLDALLHAVQGLEDRLTDDWGPAEHLLAPLEKPLVAARGPQRREVVGEAADRRRVRPLVVVHDDDEAPALVRGDVVDRLPRHATGQRPVPDDRDDVAVGLSAKLESLGEPVGVRQRGRGVAVLDDVVLGLGLARVARQAALLPQADEAARSTGDDLVDVRLVAGVPEDPVPRRVEHPVRGERELDRAEVRAEVATGPRHRAHQEVADLGGERVQPRPVETTQVAGSGQRLKHPARVYGDR